jgi:hypothetical protein
MAPTNSEAGTKTLKEDTITEEEISYTPTSPTLHTRPRYPSFVASSPGFVYSPTSPTRFSPTSPSYAAASPSFASSSPRHAAISPNFSPASYNARSPSFGDSRPSFSGFSPIFGPTPGFASSSPGFVATSPKKNTLPLDTVLSAIRCVPVDTSSKDGFRKDARMFSLTEDRPETWPNITKQEEKNIKNSIKAISWKENAAAKLLLVIVWAIVFKSSGDDHSDFWVTVEEAACKELFELPASPASYLVWIQNVKLENKGNLKDWVYKDGEAFFVVSKTGGAGGVGGVERLDLISTVDDYLPILTFTLI